MYVNNIIVTEELYVQESNHFGSTFMFLIH